MPNLHNCRHCNVLVWHANVEDLLAKSCSLLTIGGFTVQAKYVSSKSLTRAHLRFSSNKHFRKLGFTPDENVYYLERKL